MEVLAFDAHFLHTDQMLDSLEIGLTIFDCCALSEDESVHLAALITYDRKGCVSPAKCRDRLVVWPVESFIVDVQRHLRVEGSIANYWLMSLSLCSKEIEEPNLIPKQPSYLRADEIQFEAT